MSWFIAAVVGAWLGFILGFVSCALMSMTSRWPGEDRE